MLFYKEVVQKHRTFGTQFPNNYIEPTQITKDFDWSEYPVLFPEAEVSNNFRFNRFQKLQSL
jgi:hypothetical protein